MKQRKLGKQGLTVPAPGLGCMGMSEFYGTRDDQESIATIHRAVGFGVSRPAHVKMLVRAGADGVIVASALVDALGPDGRDTAALGRLVAQLRAATRR